MARPEVRIGCSGSQYPHWRRRLYPADLSQERWLEFYADRFDRAEWSAADLPCHVYVNNDASAHAVRDAERLRTLVARAAVQ